MDMNKIYEKSAQIKTIDGLKQILKHPKLYDKQLVDAVTTELERRRSLDLSFEKKSFFSRAFKYLIIVVAMAFIVSLFIEPIAWEQSDQTVNVILVCFIVITCLLIIIIDLIQERYYLLVLKADENTIDIQFLNYENEIHFSSNIKDVEINYKKSFKNRFPILEIKHNGKRVIKLYSNSANDLGSEQMDLLITDLQEYKNARS